MFCESSHAFLLFVEPDSLAVCLPLYCYSIVVNYFYLHCLTMTMNRMFPVQLSYVLVINCCFIKRGDFGLCACGLGHDATYNID